MFKDEQELPFYVELLEILEGYENLLKKEKIESIIKHIQSSYNINEKTMSFSEKEATKEFIYKKICFLKNESEKSKILKSRLLNKFSFDSFLSWIFCGVVFINEGNKIKMKIFNDFFKKYFFEKNLELIKECLGCEVEFDNTTYDYDCYFNK